MALGRSQKFVAATTTIRAAAQAVAFARFGEVPPPRGSSTAPRALALVDGRPVSLRAFTLVEGRVTRLDARTDHTRLTALDVPALTG
ncbi:hypothetical protein [Streptomyces kanasensis]|uniref:hypothetical protein n=1 Tax=Streptomyces kanasensis TaxID=936756 RepID=UPI00381CE2C7